MPACGLLAVFLFVAARPRPTLVDVVSLIPDAVVDLRYATDRNFLGRRLYPEGARCLLERRVARRLVRAAARLRVEGLRLKLWDCYRPLSVQREMWRRFPRPGYVADPSHGSNHNRGAAVDVSLVASGGEDVAVPTDFDAFTQRAHALAKDVPTSARKNRDLLRRAMEEEGFRVNRMEWWHFDAPEARDTAVLDLPPTLAGTSP